MFHHDTRHTGQSPYIGPTVPELSWSYATAGQWTHSSPAMDSAGRTYIGSDDHNMYVINPDGSLNWSYATEAEVYSSPLIDIDGKMYIGSYDAVLYSLNSNGSLNWTYRTGSAIWASPVMGGEGTVYAGSHDNNIYALISSGSLDWSYATGNDVCSSPALGNSGEICIGSNDNSIYSLDSNGALAWSYLTGDPVLSSPSRETGGGTYSGSYDNRIYAFSSIGSLRWSYATSMGPDSSPAVGRDGGIYVSSEAGGLYALDSIGSLRWRYDTLDTSSSSPAIGNDETIFFGANNKKLYSLDSAGVLKWSYTTGWVGFSSPALGSDKKICIGSANNIYCISQAPSPTPTIPPKEYPQLFLSSPKEKYSVGDDIGFEYTIIPGLNPEFNTVDVYIRAEIPGGQLYFCKTKGFLKFAPDSSYSLPDTTPQFYIYIDRIGFSGITLNYRMVPRAAQKPKERADIYILAQSPQYALYWFMQPFSFYNFSSRKATARNITPAHANGKLVEFTPNDLAPGGVYTLAGTLVRKGKNPLHSSSWLTEPSEAYIGFPIWMGLGGNKDYAMYKPLLITDRFHGALKLATINDSWPAGIYTLTVIFSGHRKDPFGRENQICSESYSFELVK
ncbi:MAG: PQQ-binding-like beta-propeller repeat protein [Candidatus Aureabacteria bacterium]|nr:PQQ-binding-like beta-propeller repeat protein [Candidatus Auribacterota bacterium]